MNKEAYIENLKTNQELTDFFMIKGCSLKTGSNHKVYFDINLADRTGEMNAKKWDVSDDEAVVFSSFGEGDLVKVKAIVSEWNGIRQMKVARIRLAGVQDNLNMADYIKAAPERSADMYDYIMTVAKGIKDSGLSAVCVNALEENHDRLMYYPAAKSNHHAEYGGLLYHMKRMLDMGLRACLVYKNLDKDWVAAGVIMHDMEKLNEILSNEYGLSGGYSVKGNLLGHIVMGAISMQERAAKAGLSEEKTVMLQHMIISHHNEPEYGSPLRPMFPEAELLHHLDMIDARMYDFEEALRPTQPGSFSERVRTLDGRLLYKPTFEGRNREDKI